ncbi:MAG: flavodoxin-dependent (E)-4-hydroxy-3-methylbut-2-enyl-diphosphate synthase, partial [Candidatus Omnitrophota bacterium]
RRFGPDVISCPTCGRCQTDIEGIVHQLKSELRSAKRSEACPKGTPECGLRTKNPFTIAIMGCEVNGPGEAKHADIGIAAGKGCGILFKKGKVIKKIDEKDFIKEIRKELKADS